MADKNYVSYSDVDGVVKEGLRLEPPNLGADFDDILKLSNARNCFFRGVEVVAGRQRENAIDLNRNSSGNRFDETILDAGKQCAILIKGGSCFNIFSDVLIRKPGGHSDIYIGDYSDQSRAKSTDNLFDNVRRSDGKPVRVAWNLVRAEKPVLVTDLDVTYQYLLSFFRTIYVEVKYLFT